MNPPSNYMPEFQSTTLKQATIERQTASISSAVRLALIDPYLKSCFCGLRIRPS